MRFKFSAQDSDLALFLCRIELSNKKTTFRCVTTKYLVPFFRFLTFSPIFCHPLQPSLCISSISINWDLKQNSSNFSHSAQCCPKEAFYGDILVCNFCTLGLDNALFVTSFLGHWWFCTFACISSVYFFKTFFKEKTNLACLAHMVHFLVSRYFRSR